MNKSNITDWILAFALFFSVTAASIYASICYVANYQPPQACNGVLNKISGKDTKVVLTSWVGLFIETAPPPDSKSHPFLLSLPKVQA
jgi:hypothetical protein